MNGLGCRACQPVFREQAAVSPPYVQSSFGTPMFQHEVFSGSLTALLHFAKKDQKMDWSACNGGDLPIVFDYVMRVESIDLESVTQTSLRKLLASEPTSPSRRE